MFENGYGVKQDYQQAFNWYLNAAKQGDAMAAYVIGTMYNYGRGVAQDKSQSNIWLNKACGNAVQTRCHQ